MIGWLAGLFLLAASSTAGGVPSPCNDRGVMEKFVEFADPSADHTPAGLEMAFGKHVVGLETCLKRWVGDGGEGDGIPLGRGVTRESYRTSALELLGLLNPKNERVASWIIHNLPSWPQSVQSQALNTLGEIGGDGSFVFLKAETRRTGGDRRELIWNSLVLMDGPRFATELESIAPTHDEQALIGSMLIALNQPVVLPALRKLMVLIPEKARVYAEQIREIEKQGEKNHEQTN